jgi:acetyltransferase-like isoleucine patch superfamily enzyme
MAEQNHSCGAKLINVVPGYTDPEIADGVGISGVIDCQGHVKIEKDVFSGHDIKILTGSHNYYMFGEERKKAGIIKGVHIKEGAWLCTGCIILQGVTIGKHSVVGAGSVVRDNIGDYEFWAGVPAKKIKDIPHG